MMKKQRKQTGGRPLALILIVTLLIGILPVNQAPVSNAAETSTSVASTSRSAYGLNNPSTTSDGVTTWDCVWFGNYPQSDAAGETKDPIKWRVLSVNGDDAFLLADTNLDVQRYNDTWGSVTWETCTMRTWLNSAFLNKAFSTSEQAAIRNTTVVNEDNPEYGTEGGNDTVDKVYLLSINEVMNPLYGFTRATGSTDTREAVNTAYVAAGGETGYEDMNSAGRTDHWWLRSPGYGRDDASYVYYYGNVSQTGDSVNYNSIAARPALHLNLSSTSSWSYAGTVTSKGGEIGTATPAPTSSAPVVTSTPAKTLEPSVTESSNPSVTGTPKPVVTSAPDKTLMPSVTETPPVGQNLAQVYSSAPAQDISKETQEKEETVPGKVTALNLKAKPKALQASWKKVSGAAGYQIWISTSKKFKKKSVKTTKNTKLTVKKLKSGKTYYVKVCAYTVKSGKKVYGAWSKTVKKKVKK